MAKLVLIETEMTIFPFDLTFKTPSLNYDRDNNEWMFMLCVLQVKWCGPTGSTGGEDCTWAGLRRRTVCWRPPRWRRTPPASSGSLCPPHEKVLFFLCLIFHHLVQMWQYHTFKKTTFLYYWNGFFKLFFIYVFFRLKKRFWGKPFYTVCKKMRLDFYFEDGMYGIQFNK